MPAPRAAPALRPPLQERSRRNLERLLAATERLLEERPFDAIAVADVVRLARTSVGAFYARFADKDALLPELYARYEASLDGRLGALARDASRPDRTLADVAARIARHFVRLFRERRHLMAALALFVRQRPDAIDDAARARRREQHAPLVEALLARRHEIGHPVPARAVELGLYFTVCAIRDRVCFPESTHAAATGAGDRELEREAARMLVGYLRLQD